MAESKIISFRRIVWAHYRTQGRHHLPWRTTRDPYRILVSEVMLQQTQVDRVLPFYTNFLKKFPTAKKLARAPLSDVLTAWQGLGYNRRAKQLKAAAGILAKDKPESAKELEKLPGVGPYTARAVATFACNEPGILIETNIRTAVMHHFFKNKNSVSDVQIEVVLKKVMPKRNVREWYWALMDYGSYLKRSGVRLNARHAKYVKQKPFTGSNREARGTILRELTKGPRSGARLLGLLGDDRTEQLRAVLSTLLSEGLIQKRGRVFTLPQ